MIITEIIMFSFFKGTPRLPTSEKKVLGRRTI